MHESQRAEGNGGRRGAHGQLMDSIYRQQRHIYDATRKYYLLGRDRLIDELDAPAGGRVLEVGCGTGRNLVLAARRHPAATFYGFDISQMMLEKASQNIARAGLRDRIHLAEGDATDFSPQALFGVSSFDRVFLSYTLSMIPDWQSVIRAAHAATAPGGRMLIVDFGDCADLPGFFKRGLGAWLARFHVHPRTELEAELRALSARTGDRLTFERPFRSYAQFAVIERSASA